MSAPNRFRRGAKRREYRFPKAEELERREVLSVSFTDGGQDFGRVFVSLGDLDGDDDLDVLASDGKVWLNDGRGQFTETHQTTVGWEGHVSALGDVDGDGDLDAVVGSRDPDGMVWVNDGSGHFIPDGQTLARDVPFDIPPDIPSSVALGDIDADGDLDAILAYGVGSAAGVTSPTVWGNDGGGQFSKSGQRLEADGRACHGVALGDMDGDGDLDVVAGHYDSRGRVWVNDGEGGFTDSEQDFYLGGPRSSPIALSDIDGDGDLDVAGMDPNGFVVWLNDGHGTLSHAEEWLRPWAEYLWDFCCGYLWSDLGLAIGDIDGDGDSDVLIDDIWLNDGHGDFSKADVVQARLISDPDRYPQSDVDLGDLDGDGDLDVVVSGKLKLNTSPRLLAGDANRDGVFDQLDIVQVLQSAKYLTGEPAGWAEGDWSRDGVFNQLDIVAAFQTGRYLQDPYAADAVFAEVGFG